MVVHSGFKAGVTVFVVGVGGHGQDGGLPVQGVGTNGAGCIDAAHHGHLHVHQNQIVAMRARLL